MYYNTKWTVGWVNLRTKLNVEHGPLLYILLFWLKFLFVSLLLPLFSVWNGSRHLVQHSVDSGLQTLHEQPESRVLLSRRGERWTLDLEMNHAPIYYSINSCDVADDSALSDGVAKTAVWRLEWFIWKFSLSRHYITCFKPNSTLYYKPRLYLCLVGVHYCCLWWST